MIAIMYKTTNPTLLARYKEALSVYEDWLNNTKIACSNAGFYKIIGVDFMIPEILFNTGLRTVNLNEFEVVSTIGHIYKFKTDLHGTESILYHRLKEISENAKLKLRLPEQYGTCQNHNFSHAVAYTLNVDSTIKQNALLTYSQVWLIKNELILTYPVSLAKGHTNHENLTNMQWEEICASEFQRIYMNGLEQELTKPI